ncbi:MAG: hypothetical protein FVQ79_00455 [Planctomycetes bacterium]|nr:hypothetical protein [Planctomycetota bacterium]
MSLPWAKSDKQYVQQRVKIDPKTECWNWKLSKHPSGYGSASRGGYQRAHRLAYRAWKGAIPKGLYICHHCDNKDCCNPDHLFVGTQSDNILDAYRKGRFRKRSNNASLKDEEVRQIKVALRDRGDKPMTEIAKEFKVSPEVIYLINKSETYKDIKI